MLADAGAVLARRPHGAFLPTPADSPAAGSTARIRATAGELVQGWLDGGDFLINSPIDLWAEAKAGFGGPEGVTIKTPGEFGKSRRGVLDFLAMHGLSDRPGVAVEFLGRIPRGKGLASSTAEMTAAILAVAGLHGLKPGPAELAYLNVRHDSTDGTYFPGISMVNQLTGKLIRSFGPPPPLRVIIVDTGGEVDSVGFDRDRARAVARRKEAALRGAVASVREGIRTRNSALIGAGATLSARINQEVLHKPLLEELLAATRPEGALGVNCAHTGTVLGVLYDPNLADGPALLARVTALAGAGAVIGDHALTGGGLR